MLQKLKPYIIGILVPLGVGGLSALLTRGNMDLYDEIIAPPLAPPALLFPIVWTLLYVLMGVSSVMIYKNKTSEIKARTSALATYASSLVVNFAWSIIFFNFKAYFLAFVWLLLLLFLVVNTALEYKKINKVASYLQIPYAAWVAFAGYLSFSIWILN